MFTHKLSTRKKITLIITSAIAMTLVKFPLSPLGDALVVQLGLDQVSEYFLTDTQIAKVDPNGFLFAVIFAPAMETVVGQWLPIKLAKKYTHNKALLILFSAFVFMLFHFPVIGFFPAAFAMGLILAYQWVKILGEGEQEAFINVTATHLIHNLGAFIFATIYTLYY